MHRIVCLVDREVDRTVLIATQVHPACDGIGAHCPVSPCQIGTVHAVDTVLPQRLDVMVCNVFVSRHAGPESRGGLPRSRTRRESTCMKHFPNLSVPTYAKC